MQLWKRLVKIDAYELYFLYSLERGARTKICTIPNRASLAIRCHAHQAHSLVSSQRLGHSLPEKGHLEQQMAAAATLLDCGCCQRRTFVSEASRGCRRSTFSGSSASPAKSRFPTNKIETLYLDYFLEGLLITGLEAPSIPPADNKVHTPFYHGVTNTIKSQ